MVFSCEFEIKLLSNEVEYRLVIHSPSFYQGPSQVHLSAENALGGGADVTLPVIGGHLFAERVGHIARAVDEVIPSVVVQLEDGHCLRLTIDPGGHRSDCALVLIHVMMLC